MSSTAFVPDLDVRQAQEAFVQMLPAIQSRAGTTFRHLNPEAKEEAVAETLALCWQNHVQCALRGKAVGASSLAHYAMLGVKSGRSLNGRNSTDVLAPRTRLLGRVTVESLDSPPNASDTDDGWWDRSDMLEDRRTLEQPFERVRIKHDYGAFLALPEVTQQERRVFELLAEGWGTGEMAKELRVSSPRVCQIKGAIGLKLDRFMAPKGEPDGKHESG
jgi:hypothetical protein